MQSTVDTSSAPDYHIIGAWAFCDLLLDDENVLASERCEGCRCVSSDFRRRYRRGIASSLATEVWFLRGHGGGGFAASKRFLDALEGSRTDVLWQVLELTDRLDSRATAAHWTEVYAALGVPQVMELPLRGHTTSGWRCTVCENYQVGYSEPRVVHVSVADVPMLRPRLLTVGFPRSTVDLAVRTDLLGAITPLLRPRDELIPLYLVDPSETASPDDLPPMRLDREVPWSSSDIEW